MIALLVPAMAAGERLESVPAVSEQLLFNLAGIRDIFHAWHPQFSRIAIEATPRIDTGAAIASRAATFFSGGVDSFYTLLKRWRHENLPVPLTHMIFMYGIERSLEDTQNAEASERQARRVAAAIGVECIVGKTNLRTLFPLNWERFYFGVRWRRRRCHCPEDSVMSAFRRRSRTGIKLPTVARRWLTSGSRPRRFACCTTAAKQAARARWRESSIGNGRWFWRICACASKTAERNSIAASATNVCGPQFH